jgi:streptogramin lyase
VDVIDMHTPTWALAVDDRSVWVQVGDVGMGRIDRATNTDTGIRVNEVPQMEFEGPDLWALDVGTGIVKVDPISGAILRTIPVISGFYITVDGTTAWVTDTGHSLDRVDLTTGKVVKSIDVPNTPKEMAVFAGSVWVACDQGGSVARIDIATNKVRAVIPAGNRPVNLAVGEGAVWVWNHERQLLRINPATNKVVATIDGVAETLGVGVAVGGGSVWVAMPGGIGRVDPASNTVVDVIPLGAGGYVDLAWYDGELWASSTDRGYVYRIHLDR